jgi:hypothetical protein
VATFEGSLLVPQVRPFDRAAWFRSCDRQTVFNRCLLARSAFDLEFRLDVLRRKALAPATSYIRPIQDIKGYVSIQRLFPNSNVQERSGDSSTD